MEVLSEMMAQRRWGDDDKMGAVVAVVGGLYKLLNPVETIA